MSSPEKLRNLTIKEFREKFESIAQECSIDGETVNSHSKILTKVTILDEEYNEYDCEFDASTWPGCGCWAGVIIILKKRNK